MVLFVEKNFPTPKNLAGEKSRILLTIVCQSEVCISMCQIFYGWEKFLKVTLRLDPTPNLCADFVAIHSGMAEIHV